LAAASRTYSAGHVAGNHDARPGLLRSAPLPTVAEVDGLKPAELPAFIVQCAALQMQAAMRLQAAARDQGDDVCTVDAKEAAQRIGVSIDMVRDKGDAWGIALVVAHDREGKPTRVVYPLSLLRAFLERRPATTKSAA